ncbi:MAG: cysteine desulfurase family protein [Verrucomicrobiota bacterium]|nr:cysteine desulfurase family protein [Verrucomicrobiota bacterium]
MPTPIYLDYNATTPLDPTVVEEMLPFLTKAFGNASSIHSFGRDARAALDESRDRMARLLKVKPVEIIFTGSGTESDNLALFGLARENKSKGKHLLTTQIEHHAVLHAFEYLEKHEEFDVTYLPVNALGRVEVEEFTKALKKDTILASVMSANNETGTIQPIAELAAIARKNGVLFHTDAIQSFGKVPVFPHDWNVDALSLSAHKFYGPKGSGALFLRHGLSLQPHIVGGAHEGDRRAGTENVAGIAGMTVAAERALGLHDDVLMRSLTEKLWAGLSQIRGIIRNGDPVNRISNTLNVSFNGIDGEELLMNADLEGLAVSSGSACMVGSVQASHVLLAMGVDAAVAKSTVRFSIGKFTCSEEIDRTIEVFNRICNRLRPTRAA